MILRDDPWRCGNVMKVTGKKMRLVAVCMALLIANMF